MARGNHRRRISTGNVGSTPRGMEKVSQQTIRNTEGVFIRIGPGFDQANTVKSKLSPRPLRGLRPPGEQPRNFPSPQV